MSNYSVIASSQSWIEGEAIRQLEQTARLPGMRQAIGLPDLHPGKGTPVGAAFISQGCFYPHLVGNDIGCGMGLWQTDLPARKLKLSRWADRLHGLEAPWGGDRAAWLADAGVEHVYTEALGSIGGGNHFAELQQIRQVPDSEGLAALGLDANGLCLLVHSGSRGLGEQILRAHTDTHGAGALQAETSAAQAYLTRHNQAVAWGVANRALIAHRFLEALGAQGSRHLDVCHNSVTPLSFQGEACWLHRKGAAPADQGAVVIPGSRGSVSYLVQPTGDPALSGWSLAHGAGRKWSRSETRGRLEKRFSAQDLTRTELGSWVICERTDLLYEEAPQAYKNIDQVVQDLVDAGCVKVLAILQPLITYKTRR
jgi:release factor H-coupled RctB family protein